MYRPSRDQLLLRMHTAYHQSGTFVVDSLLPADRLLIIVSGRKATLKISVSKLDSNSLLAPLLFLSDQVTVMHHDNATVIPFVPHLV